jgi:hypothetical protein
MDIRPRIWKRSRLRFEFSASEAAGTYFVAFFSEKERPFSEKKATIINASPRRKCHWADAARLACSVVSGLQQFAVSREQSSVARLKPWRPSL